MLTGALGISRIQWVWLTLRKKWFTLKGIDAVFGVTSDPTYLINTIMLKRAKVATIMAMIMWMIPIAAILTPGTISVGRFPHIEHVPCSVRSLRFPFDHNSTATILADSSLAKNMTVENIGYWFNDPTVDPAVVKPTVWVSNMIMRLLKLSAYTGSISRAIDLLPVGSPSITTLGEQCGANCSYEVEFLGPSVTCDEFTSWSTVQWHNASQFMVGAYYYATATSNLSDSVLVGVLSPEPPIRRIVFECRSSTTRYTVQQSILERRFLEPTITKVELVILPRFQGTAIYPNTTYLGQASVMNVFNRLLYGYLQDGYGSAAEIALTPVLEDIMTNGTNVGSALEQMAYKMVVSMLASDVLLNGTAYALDVTATQQTTCTTTKFIVLYVYSARTLILVYGLTVACALVMTVAGFFALRQNGMASTGTASGMIRTTRNRTLDELIVGSDSLGGDTMSKELEKVELRFGALGTGENGTAHFALGVRGEIFPIKRD